MIRRLMDDALNYPKVIVGMTVLLVVAALAQFPRMKVDTDPENMLPADAPVRVFHHQAKEEFALYDFIVLGVVNERNAEGVFNVSTLTKVYNITEEIKGVEGVIAREIIALSTKDNIEQGDAGSVRFNWLMAAPPKTGAEALALRLEAQDHPMFKGSVVSVDGKATALYIPIEKKEISYEVAQKIRGIVRRYSGDEEYHITGLPVAEDQFGVEMFKQMAVSAPLAGLIIFLLMWYFFKSVQLIIAPMILAVATVLLTMGLLIGLGFPVHIMSSMIPIFLMPIAVLDSVHILSEFSDKYRQFGNRQETIRHVFKELFSPMLFTSLTSVAGFYSLSFSPIPPVQVFGVFVAIGIAIAWILTILFIPAYVMLMNENSFKNFGQGSHEERGRWIDKWLQYIKGISTGRFHVVLVMTVLLVAASIYGISRIRVNDNPVRWFTPAHPIRVADRVLNKHFAGTYEAFLVFESLSMEEGVFIVPDMLRYLDGLQQALVASGDVGKATSLVDIVKKVYDELLGGDKKNEVVPDTKAAVAQCLIAFENSHKPDDLWHVTTPDYRKANIWLQLKSGDNRDMGRVARFVDRYIADNPPPFEVNYQWAGLTYINVIWQNNMVGGMLNNFIGSFIIVLFMMLFLFRSPFKALVSMIPLTVTILFIYSLLGFVGRDYDMPVAVLSALTLGLSVDFAIHFIQRAMDAHEKRKSWEATAQEMFTGPGRAIVLNALVVAIGFLPLLAAPLVPYKTVGFFMFMIMAVSGVATLFILPAITSLNPPLMLARPSKGICFQGGQCVLLGVFVAMAVAYVLLGYSSLGWARSLFISVGVIVAFSAVCFLVSKIKICLKGKAGSS
jgi:predicted RND superfamily exporter protein